MPLAFHKAKGPSQCDSVRCLLQLVEVEPDVFRMVARIFDRFKTEREAEKEGFEEELELMIYQPAFRVPQKSKELLFQFLLKIYHEPNFQMVRSTFLEEVVVKYGPIEEKGMVYKQVMKEPLIYDGDHLIGGYRCRMDVVFYQQDDLPMEMIECKANIHSFLSETTMWNRWKGARLKKIHYMINVYQYLKQYYVEPVIGFAYYNRNSILLQKNVHETWGLSYIRLYSRQDLYERIRSQTKASS